MSSDVELSNIYFDDIDCDDLDVLMEIEVLAYLHPWKIVNMSDCLQSQYIAQKMLHLGSIIAYGFASAAAGESHLLNLTVMPSYQKKGLGEKMLRHLIEKVEQKNALEMFLEVRESNHSARRLYERLGFNELAVRKGYYPNNAGRREDAIVMAKIIGNPFL